MFNFYTKIVSPKLFSISFYVMPKKVLRKKSIMNTKTNVDQNNHQNMLKLEL